MPRPHFRLRIFRALSTGLAAITAHVIVFSYTRHGRDMSAWQLTLRMRGAEESHFFLRAYALSPAEDDFG